MADLSAAEKTKTDGYLALLNNIMEQPGFDLFLQDKEYHLLAQSVIAYAAHALNNFTKRTGLGGGKTHLFFILALGIWLGRRGVLGSRK